MATIKVDTEHHPLEDYLDDLRRMPNGATTKKVYERVEHNGGKYTYHYVTLRVEDPNFVDVSDLS